MVIFVAPPVNNSGAGAGGVGGYLGTTLADSGLFKSYFVSYASSSASPRLRKAAEESGLLSVDPKSGLIFLPYCP